MIPFVDAHVHFWCLGRLRYPWLTPPFDPSGPNGSVEAIARDYLPADYRREAAAWNVVGAVHVEAGADSRDAAEETAWLEGLGEAEGLPNGIVAFAALHEPNVAELLAVHAAFPRVRGIRHIVNWHRDPARSYTPRDLTLDPDWARGYALLERHGLSFDLQCYPEQMERVAAIARRHPGVPLVLNHCGMPVLSDGGGRDAWRRGLAALASLPHAAVKLSGLGFVRRDWDAALARSVVDEILALFGAGRVMAASDFPTDRLFADFDRAVGAIDLATRHLPEADRRAIWGGNAVRIYRLDASLTGDEA